MNSHQPASPSVAGARPRERRMDVLAALPATAVFVFAASAAETWELHEAACKGDVATVTRLLEVGSDPNQGNAPDTAASEGHDETVRLLLEAGADPDLRDPWGTAPLRGRIERPRRGSRLAARPWRRHRSA